jgi:DNA-binding winged helix-turn-helix (wHTH) protein/Tol biopolymer transport system component
VTLRDVSQTGSAYAFRDVLLDVSAERLVRGDTNVKLRPKSFQVLRYLAERSGRLVTREELLRAIWPDVIVTDESLTKCIAEIRKALNDDAQQVIRTVARRGYVFAAPVTKTVAFPRPTDPQAEHGPAAVVSISDGRSPRVLGAIPSPLRMMSPLQRRTAMATMLVVAGGLAVGLLRATRSERASPTAAIDYTQLTNFTDAAFSPALSPDGRMLTFVRGNPGTVGGPGDIYVKLLPDGEPVQLTHDGRGKMSPVFTPGGDRVSYAYTSLMTDPQNWSTWTVSVFGGEPSRSLSNASAMTWIPGTSPPRVLFSRVDTGTHMSLVAANDDGTESRTVYAPPARGGMAHRSFVSPDRTHMLVVEMDSGWSPCRLVPFDATASDESSPPAGRSVGPSPGQCASAAWSPDGRWMYFAVNTGDGYHIWRQRFPDGRPEQVTFGASEERDVAFAPDGRSFVTSIGTRQSTLWLHDAHGDRKITSEGYASLPILSIDGKTLYYLLESRANRRYVSGELWSANLESGKRERLLPRFVLTDYSISGDGKRLLFVAIGDDGKISVWVAPLDGTAAPRRLSDVTAHRAFFGADGEVILFGSDQSGARFVYRIGEDGTGLRKAFADQVIAVYDVSPGGEYAAAWSGAAVQILPLRSGPAVTASSLCAAAGGENRGSTPPCISWSRDGRFLRVHDRRAGQVWALPIPPGRSLPALPEHGITSAEQLASWPGARVISRDSAFLADDPSVYAFFERTTHRNIYRVRVPDAD